MAYSLPFEVLNWDYEQALDQLHQALHFGIQPMLETVIDMLAELGNPDLCFDALQIAGTNGKTSTARYTAAILTGEGLTCALYTSPGLTSYTDRMEIGGYAVSKKSFAHGLSAATQAGMRVNERRIRAGERPYDITEFDLITVAAAVVFAEADVDVVVLECGMGGRWDATSAYGNITNCAITGIGLDHMAVLGDTLEKIAAEKAAIIKNGRSCVLGVGTATPSSVEDVFLSQCQAQNVIPSLVRPDLLSDATGLLHPGTPAAHEMLPHASYRISRHAERVGGSMVMDITSTRASYQDISALKPDYQAANICCAVQLAEDYLGRALDEDKLFDSVVTCPTPGRFDVYRTEPLVLVDASHNPQSIAAFISAIQTIEPDVSKRPALLCAIFADKKYQEVVRLLVPEFPEIYCTQTDSPRALAATELAASFEQAGKKVSAIYPTTAEALEALADAHQDCVCCGTITLAGEIAALLGHPVPPKH